MGLGDLPEVKLARRLFAKHSLSIPFDIDNLISKYGEIIYKNIPFEGIDGVSINIKVPGKSPKIIVNTSLPPKRQLFTKAHELGHIIIPWHLGTIVDDIYSQGYKDYVYSELEHEANRFAAELLMPAEWLMEFILRFNDDYAKLHQIIAEKSGVSDYAAAIRLIETLPKNVIYTAVENGYVVHSGRTANTDAYLQDNNTIFKKDFYPYFDSYTNYQPNSITYHWWKISDEINITTEDTREWRDILDEITKDINPKEGATQFKKSINGIIAFANGKVKRQTNYNLNAVIAACISRLRREGLESFTNHPDFESFIKIKVTDLVNNNKK
jgi:Zn-dependent peptidase ImmA (M78 family)